tara:strand:+ start:6123 stop:6947 length:825 start_codon:yes stop_codon:yes gene_type:complete
MINLIKKLVHGVIKKFGYRLQHLSPIKGQTIPENEVTFKNFVSLANSYELLINDQEEIIEKNQLRPYLMAKLTGTLSSEAYYIIESIAKTKELHGSVCEFGVGSGETSVLIANEILKSDKNLYLFDSFQGLPQPTKEDQLIDDIFNLGDIESYQGLMASPIEVVKKKLDDINFPNNRLFIRSGWFEDTITKKSNLPDRISFAYVDFDFYEPIKLALEFLDKTTIADSIIIVDDYDYFSSGSKLAVDEFLNDNPSYEFYIPDKKIGHFIILKRKK